MSLLCGSNPALEGIKEAGKSLKAQLAGGKGALGAIGAAAAGIKEKVGQLQAVVKQLESFQEELANLPANLTAGAIAAFKAKWGDKVPDIDGYVDKLKNGISLDFCKDVPNVKVDPETGSTVTQAKTSPTPNVNPPEAVPVEKTVVNNYEKKSTGKSEQVPSEVQVAYQDGPVKEFKEQILLPALDKGRGSVESKIAISESKDYQAVKTKLRKTGKSSEQLIAEGQLNQKEIAAAKAYDKAEKAVEGHNLAPAAIDRWWMTVREFHAGMVTEKDLELAEKRNKKNADYADYLDFFDKTKTLGETWSEVIKKYVAVTNNRSVKQ